MRRQKWEELWNMDGGVTKRLFWLWLLFEKEEETLRFKWWWWGVWKGGMRWWFLKGGRRRKKLKGEWGSSVYGEWRKMIQNQEMKNLPFLFLNFFIFFSLRELSLLSFFFFHLENLALSLSLCRVAKLSFVLFHFLRTKYHH